MKKCRTCEVTKALGEFGNSSRSKDGKSSRCSDCQRSYDRDRYQSSEAVKAALYGRNKDRYTRNQKYIHDYLVDHPCIDCGESDPVVLTFDHRDGTVKLFNISQHNVRSLTVIQEEIDKCDIRCANCHLRRTAVQFGWHKWKLL